LVVGIGGVGDIGLAPLVSGKDSIYHYVKTDEGPASIPCTLLPSGFGIVEKPEHVIGASIRAPGNAICMVGGATRF
jgi:phosphoribosylformylglycinamidine synthase subunit PurSL